MRLVEDQEKILREVVEQRGRGLAWLPIGQVTRVVLDAVAEPHLLHHLDVVLGSLLDALLLEEAPFAIEEAEALLELVADAADRFPHLLLRRDVVRAGVDGVVLQRRLHLAAEGIDLLDGLDRVAEELDADRGVLLGDRKYFHDVAAHAKGTAVEVDVVSLVLDVDEHAQQVVAPVLLARVKIDQETVVGLGAADAVDAADAGDDDDVAA